MSKIDEIIKRFILNPENFLLFRGESEINQGGLHFTTDEIWAKNFGNTILKGTLPKGSKIHLLNKDDFQTATDIALRGRKVGETNVYKFILEKNNCDAIVGTDAMRGNEIDVIVHPKHLSNFKPKI